MNELILFVCVLNLVSMYEVLRGVLGVFSFKIQKRTIDQQDINNC